MINIDYLTIAAFIKENLDFFTGARIQKIRQTNVRDLILVLRNNGQTRKLYININPDIYHICFMESKREQSRNLTYPVKPPMFCMLLRKYIDNSKITGVNLPVYERIVEFEILTKNEIDGEKVLILAVELMGKYSNIILYDKTSSQIIGCAHNVGGNKSQVRELYGGIPYIYPPKPNKKDFLRYFGDVNYENLYEDFLGVSKHFARLCQGQNAEQIKDMLELKGINPALNDKEYSIFGNLLPPGKVYSTSVNDMIDEYYSQKQCEKVLTHLKMELTGIVSARYQKVKTSLNKINSLRNKRDNTEKYHLWGELLIANSFRGENYISKISLHDYNSGRDIIIPLDETLTMIDNANRYYRLYAKSKRTKEKTQAIIDSLNANKYYLEEVLYNIDAADDLDILSGIKDELCPDKPVGKKPKEAIMLVEIGGFSVYIGRNNKQNDYIVSKLAKDDDYWFHIKGVAGSHILLKTRDNKTPGERILYECCKLAKKFSSVSEREKAGVIYTRRKYLRKPSGANPGYVTYRNEKEIYI